VDDRYDELYAELNERGVIYWGASDDVPTESVGSIIKILAYEVADEFLGINDEARLGRLKFEAYGIDGNSGAFGDLQRLSTIDYVPTTVEAEYF